MPVRFRRGPATVIERNTSSHVVSDSHWPQGREGAER